MVSSVLGSGVGEGRQKLSEAAVQQRIGQSLQLNTNHCQCCVVVRTLSCLAHTGTLGQVDFG